MNLPLAINLLISVALAAMLAYAGWEALKGKDQ